MLFVSELSVELLLEELVSVEEALLALSVPLWPLAEAPLAVVSVVSVAPISPVSLRAQPAKQIKVAAINANFFIIQLLVCAREPSRTVQPGRWFTRTEIKSLVRVNPQGREGGLRASNGLIGPPSG